MERGGCCKIQLINQDGVFNERELENFMRTTYFLNCGTSYSIVAIFGPQGSGKSTLMNHLFGTNFLEMDANKGRTQTTKGIWIAKCSDMGTFTIAMDSEGTDSRERGQDDTAFEKQSALFALAIADIVLINMWCHDIGRDQAANKPLLKTVFEVMMRLFSPRKKTLVFVIRDRSLKTPPDRLWDTVWEDIQKIWEGIAKPEAHKSAPLSKFFEVLYTCLPSYDVEEQQFKEKVAAVKKGISNVLAGDKREAIHASEFSISVQKIWKTIKENEDLDLPAIKVMVATIRCEEIAHKKLKLLASDKDWSALKEEVQDGVVSGFGKKLHSILITYISGYEKETDHYDEAVRTAKWRQLKSEALNVVRGAYDTNLGQLRTKTLNSFKTMLTKLLNQGGGLDGSVIITCEEHCMLEFDNGCEDAAVRWAQWDTSKIKEELRRDIRAHTVSVLTTKLLETEANSQRVQPVQVVHGQGYSGTASDSLRVVGATVSFGAAVAQLIQQIISFSS